MPILRMRGGIFLFLFVANGQRIRQVHILTRHGAREHLQKSSVDLDETGGFLTTAGILQMEQLGIRLRDRYNDDDFPLSYHAVSSATQRTIVSANALLRGFNNATNHNVPVYSMKDVNDVDIRGYNKCPTFQRHLESLYESEDWKRLEASERTILQRLATTSRYAKYANNDGMIPLTDVWNVFDDIAVCQSRQTDDCDDTILTDDEWRDLKDISHQAELLKYHSETAGDLVGTNLLRRIAQEQRPGLYLYSGHYPTLLPVLAKLQIADFYVDVIPPFASALLLEEHMDGSFQVVFKPGDSEIANVVHTWDQREAFERSILSDSYDWCAVCDNHSADVCLMVSDAPSLNSTVAGFVLGGGVGALLVLAILTFRHKCSRRTKEPPRRAVLHSNGDFS